MTHKHAWIGCYTLIVALVVSRSWAEEKKPAPAVNGSKCCNDKHEAKLAECCAEGSSTKTYCDYHPSLDQTDRTGASTTLGASSGKTVTRIHSVQELAILLRTGSDMEAWADFTDVGVDFKSKRLPKPIAADRILQQLIVNHVQPESWADMGGTGTIDYFAPAQSFVVTHTLEAQEQIAKLLRDLKSEAEKCERASAREELAMMFVELFAGSIYDLGENVVSGVRAVLPGDEIPPPEFVPPMFAGFRDMYPPAPLAFPQIQNQVWCEPPLPPAIERLSPALASLPAPVPPAGPPISLPTIIQTSASELEKPDPLPIIIQTSSPESVIAAARKTFDFRAVVENGKTLLEIATGDVAVRATCESTELATPLGLVKLRAGNQRIEFIGQGLEVTAKEISGDGQTWTFQGAVKANVKHDSAETHIEGEKLTIALKNGTTSFPSQSSRTK